MRRFHAELKIHGIGNFFGLLELVPSAVEYDTALDPSPVVSGSNALHCIIVLNMRDQSLMGEIACVQYLS